MSTSLILGVLAGAILSGTPLLYATLGETIVERSGIVNLGLEGVLLIGASSGSPLQSPRGAPIWGLSRPPWPAGLRSCCSASWLWAAGQTSLQAGSP